MNCLIYSCQSIYYEKPNKYRTNVLLFFVSRSITLFPLHSLPYSCICWPTEQRICVLSTRRTSSVVIMELRKKRLYCILSDEKWLFIWNRFQSSVFIYTGHNVYLLSHHIILRILRSLLKNESNALEKLSKMSHWPEIQWNFLERLQPYQQHDQAVASLTDNMMHNNE